MVTLSKERLPSLTVAVDCCMTWPKAEAILLKVVRSRSSSGTPYILTVAIRP